MRVSVCGLCQRRYVCACDRCVCVCAARLESAAPGSIEGGGHRPEREVLPLPVRASECQLT